MSTKSRSQCSFCGNPCVGAVCSRCLASRYKFTERTQRGRPNGIAEVVSDPGEEELSVEDEVRYEDEVPYSDYHGEARDYV